MVNLRPVCLFVLQFAIYAAYAGRLETAFLTDEVASANAVLHSPTLTPASPRSPLSTATTAQQAEAPAAAEQPPQVCHQLLVKSDHIAVVCAFCTTNPDRASACHMHGMLTGCQAHRSQQVSCKPCLRRAIEPGTCSNIGLGCSRRPSMTQDCLLWLMASVW